jgi:hypothetical protein
MSTAAIIRHNYFRILTGLILAALLITLPTLLFGQGYLGTVSGELTDSSGAVVQGVKVVLTDQRKGFTFSATSDSTGRYLFRAIPPGLYSVTADMNGFEKTVRTNVKVDVNENASADMVLKVAGGAQWVDVQAEGQRLHTENAVTGQVIDRKFINDLPLIERQAMNLTYLTPGVTDMSDSNHQGDTNGTNFVSNGSRGAGADILTDGASVTNAEPNGGITQATYIPSPEAVEEFKVEQSNFSAEYGFSGASVVNMVTRSGTNKFHGSAYDFVRDQITDANNWFNNHYSQAIAPLKRNNYGFTIGGPIIKNKTFFFADYDAYRQTTQSVAQFGVPSVAERAGDFGEVCGAQGGTFDGTGLCSVAAGQIWDPYQRHYDSSVGGAVANSATTFIPFNNLATYTSPGNPALAGTPYQVPGGPGNLIDPVASKMMSLFPTPNINNGIYDNWFGSGPAKGYNDQFDIKVDQRFSEKNLMSVKYSYQYNHGVGFNCFKNFTDPCAGGPNWTNAHLFAINDTETISPSLLLTTTLGFTRGVWHINSYNPQGVSDPLGQLGFPSYLDSNGFQGVPAMYIGQYLNNGSTNIGTDPYGNYRLGQDTGQLTVALDKVHGSHELKFGFEGRLHQMNYIQTNAPVGTFNFDQNGSSAGPNDISTYGGDPMASFLMGKMSAGAYEIQIRPATENFQYGAFLQDNWKATHKLTLNLGLRYDVTLPRTERHNRQDYFDPNVASPLQVPGLGTLHGGEVFVAPDQRTAYVTDWSDFQPRFGLAYQFAPKMVVRAGYGIYYGQSRSGVTGVMPYGGQGFNQYTSEITTYQNDGSTPYLQLSNPYPNGLIQPAGNTLGLLNDIGQGANGPLRRAGANPTPNEQSWSFGIERELPSNILVTAQYVGKKGTHLPFSGANQLNILGPEIENYSPAQINNLFTFVNNPFSSANGGPISDPNSVLSSPQIQQFQLNLPFPQFTGVANDVQMIANSTYHALQVGAEKRYSNGLQLLANFTWSKSIDDSSVADDNVTWIGSNTSLQDPNKPWLERSLSTFDIPWVVQFSYTYELPIGRGKAFLGNMPRALDAIIGGWKTSGVWRMQDGRPLALTTADGTALPFYGGVRPNIVGTPKRNDAADWMLNNYFVDPDVFQLPPNFTLGDVPRTIGSVRGPSSFSADLSIAKQFKVREEMNFEVRLEAENAFNHPVFGTPDTTLDDGSFGQTFYQANSPRQVQLAVKFNF